MSTIIPITDRVSLLSDGFGSFNQNVVSVLLKRVIGFFAMHGAEASNLLPVIVINRNSQRPECCIADSRDGILLHIIYLDTFDDYWCQWVYQFSHEYCHHLINGKLTGETKGLMWLEESICHVASIACLEDMAQFCYASDNPSLNKYSDSVIDYLSRLFSSPEFVVYQQYLSKEDTYKVIPENLFIPLHNYIEDNKSILETTYSDNHYNYIAGALYPHFHNNASLWKIIKFLGNMQSWECIDSLFHHLIIFSDETNRESITNLIKALQIV